jgi:uncharacterized protein (DUF2252 family)
VARPVYNVAMAEPPPRPNMSPRAEADRVARLAREAEALRANLRRRKAQLAARRTADGEAPENAELAKS